MASFKTVKTSSTAEFVVERSKFISSVFPVSNSEKAAEIISQTKQQFWDAKHNVFAYVLRENNLCRFSDDGEPHSTAGLPTLEILKKSELVDVLVVTTRYFGGILLGTGGLVRAYSTAAKLALEAATVVEITECEIFSVKCPYSDFELLSKLIVESGGKIENTEYSDLIEFIFILKSGLCAEFQLILNNAFCGRLIAKKIGEQLDSI